MSPVEKLAKGLFAANLIAAADASGVTPPAVIRIEGAWNAHANRNGASRKRWLKAAALILANCPGIDLAALTDGTPDVIEAPATGVEEIVRRIIDRATLVFGMLAAFAVGFALAAFFFHPR